MTDKKTKDTGANTESKKAPTVKATVKRKVKKEGVKNGN